MINNQGVSGEVFQAQVEDGLAQLELPVGDYRSPAGIVEMILEFEENPDPLGGPRGAAVVTIKSITLGPSG
jgi:hypothetical protein